LLPCALAPLLVQGTLLFGDAILLEAALSFLGLGVPPPTPSWGNLIADGRHRLVDAWWIATLPGLAIAATILALSVLGDVARERMMGTGTERLDVETRAQGGRRHSGRGGARGMRRLVPGLARLVGFSLLVACTAASAGDPAVELDVRKAAGVAEIVARNDGALPVTVRIDLTRSVNLEADRALPCSTTVPPESERTVLVLEQKEPGLPWSYRYRWSWTEGALDHASPPEERSEPAPREDYSLPFAPGFAFRVGERLDDDPSHNGENAVDWLTPAGTAVYAAKGGTVARIPATPDECLRILHGDGSIGCYRGLQQIRVRFGDPVEAGDELGAVAVPAPFRTAHLHFHVSRADGEGGSLWLPLTFLTGDGAGVRLEPGSVAMRPHEDGADDGDEWPSNAVQAVVTCRSVDRNGHPLDRTSRFSPEEVVHVHVAFGAPDIYPIRIDFLQEGRAEPRSVRRFPSQPEWEGVHVTLDLGGIDQPEGDWVIETRVGERVHARTAFSVSE
jgi:hypothetical protein